MFCLLATLRHCQITIIVVLTRSFGFVTCDSVCQSNKVFYRGKAITDINHSLTDIQTEISVRLIRWINYANKKDCPADRISQQ